LCSLYFVDFIEEARQRAEIAEKERLENEKRLSEERKHAVKAVSKYINDVILSFVVTLKMFV
jgi:uncharacterized protein YaiL (DUF2058 family)